MLELNGVTTRVGSFQLGPLSFRIPSGGYWGVLGASGAGKTKLLEVIAGIVGTCQGTIAIAGRDLTLAAPEARSVGFVYQQPLLFPHLDVAGNIGFAGLQMAPEQRRQRAAELARPLNIAELLERRVGSLSGGEQQRVAIARALFAAPALLLLDEPVSALDDETRELTTRLLRDVHQRTGCTVLQTAVSMSHLEHVEGVLRLAAGKLA